MLRTLTKKATKAYGPQGIKLAKRQKNQYATGEKLGWKQGAPISILWKHKKISMEEGTFKIIFHKVK